MEFYSGERDAKLPPKSKRRKYYDKLYRQVDSRVKAGETVKAVSDDLGIKYTTLMGFYSRRKKASKGRRRGRKKLNVQTLIVMRQAVSMKDKDPKLTWQQVADALGLKRSSLLLNLSRHNFRRPNPGLAFCENCDGRFKMAHPNHRFCNSKCKNEARAIRIRIENADEIRCRKLRCDWCNKQLVFKPGAPTFGKHAKRFCNKVCMTRGQAREKKERLKKARTKDCAQCGTRFVGANSNALYCGKPCLRKASNRKANPYVAKTCLWCEEEFVTANSRKVYCEPSCSNSSYKRKVNPIVDKTCLYCNQLFTPKNMKVKYCDDYCVRQSLNKRQRDRRKSC